MVSAVHSWPDGNTSTTILKVKMGVVLTENSPIPADYSILSSALTLAISDVRHLFRIDVQLLPSLYEGGCEESGLSGLRQTVVALQNFVDFIVGPACTDDFVVAGKLTTVFKTPLISGGASLVDNTNAWPYVTRTGYNINTQWSFFTLICRRYDWNDMVVMYETDSSSYATSGSMLISLVALIGRVRSDTNSTKVATVRMGVVLTTGASLHSDYIAMEPAIALAIKHAREEFHLDIVSYLSLYSIEGASQCQESGLVALSHVVVALQSSVDFLLGPSCTDDFVLASKLATVFKVPLLTGGATLVERTEPWTYVGRTAYNVGTQVSFLLLILQKFRWRNVAVLYEMESVVHKTTGQSKFTSWCDGGTQFTVSSHLPGLTNFTTPTLAEGTQ
ncbi:hypothetical protein BV898_16626 [Hypsibius exemplaris]|uniref:Receptor ligand binding region domain-containing protein n=1 Tax=Hypsibius exemplaris TaxID=2072580 RepID=A0A9X6NDK8_HYPEX|nr:hypothetical protein BV898_16626 [Hypsibius exemplaris]